MVRSEGHHPGSQLNGSVEFFPLFGGGRLWHQRLEFLDGGIVIVHHPLVLGGEIIVGDQVTLDALDSRGRILHPQLVDVLVRVHGGLDAVLFAVGVHIRQEGLALFALLQLGNNHHSCLASIKDGLELRVGFDLLFELPECLQAVPVAVFDRDQDPADESWIHLTDDFTHRRLQIHRRLELRQVQDPVQTEVTLLDINGLLQIDHQFLQRSFLCGEGIQVLEIPADFGEIPIVPPFQELAGIGVHDPAIVGSQHACRLGLSWDDGAVQVAVYALADPCLTKREAKAPVHVVQRRSPPAIQAPIHRRDRPGTVVIIIEPEQPLLFFALPLDWKFVVTEKCAKDLVRICHLVNLLWFCWGSHPITEAPIGVTFRPYCLPSLAPQFSDIALLSQQIRNSPNPAPTFSIFENRL